MEIVIVGTVFTPKRRLFLSPSRSHRAVSHMAEKEVQEEAEKLVQDSSVVDESAKDAEGVWNFAFGSNMNPVALKRRRIK